MRKRTIIVVSIIFAILILGVTISLLGGTSLFNSRTANMIKVSFTEKQISVDSGHTKKFKRYTKSDGSGIIYFEIEERKNVSHKIDIRIHNRELYVSYQIVSDPGWSSGTTYCAISVNLDSTQLAKITKVRIVGDISVTLSPAG